MTEEEELRFRRTLSSATEAIGVPLDPAKEEQCLLYTQRLLAVNEYMNLTRITEPEAIAIKHFADALTVLRAFPDLPEIASLIDVGTGAGFPGLVLKIARPGIRLTLLDSLAKRLTFLSETISLLGITGTKTVHARAEDAARLPVHRDAYDLVTARAVAALPKLLAWCGPLVKVGGRFVAMKGTNIAEEIEDSKNIVASLGLRFVTDYTCTLPGMESDTEPPLRHLLVYEKIRPTGRKGRG